MSESRINKLAGALPPASMLVDVPRLVTAYYTERPDPGIADQRVTFGTSGHRGVSFERTFNEWHVAAIAQAIVEYRREQGTDGPLFVGSDTHALSAPATATAVEVLAANGVEVMLSRNDEPTPTPAVSHAIIVCNRGRRSGLADGIVVTPSHNPPDSGGFKYNPPTGGPADSTATGWIEKRANALMADKLAGVRRLPLDAALRAPTTHRHDFLGTYVADLGAVIDFDAIRSAKLAIGVDPLGGAGVHYWPAIADRYNVELDVINPEIDPTFRFVTVDWDGKIRMDPSSPYAMRGLIDRVGAGSRYDLAVACDTDHDRHGIVARSTGLLPANHYLAVMIDYLFRHRSGWRGDSAVGKTVVSSSMIDRVAKSVGRRVNEVPVGFKWYVDGLLDGSLGFAGEESAGAAFLRRDGTVWTTDKDGMAPALLAAEMTAVTGRDPGDAYRALEAALGACTFDRVDRPATPEQKRKLAKLSPSQVTSKTLAGEPIEAMLVNAPGNGAAIGGLKVVAANGWFAARPSGTENIYKVYAESFNGPEHLARVIDEAEKIVTASLQ